MPRLHPFLVLLLVRYFYVKIHHVLLVTWTSKVRATTQEDMMCIQIGLLARYAVSAVQDASFMLTPEVRLFADDAAAHTEVRWGHGG